VYVLCNSNQRLLIFAVFPNNAALGGSLDEPVTPRINTTNSNEVLKNLQPPDKYLLNLNNVSSLMAKDERGLSTKIE
jgi:hypothetical protein